MKEGRQVDFNPVLKPHERLRLDESPDALFYQVPRVGVHHVDEAWRVQLTDLYRRLLLPGSSILDLCSSWTSHLPPNVIHHTVLGHGMNEAELEANTQLTGGFVVQDLNLRATLSWVKDGSMDAVLLANGWQYLQRPEVVASEALRVLRPGGSLMVSFSDACWPEKAVAGWLDRGGEERQLLISKILQNAGFHQVQQFSRVPPAHTPASPPAAPSRTSTHPSPPAASSSSESEAASAPVMPPTSKHTSTRTAPSSSHPTPDLQPGASPDPFYAIYAFKPPKGFTRADRVEASRRRGGRGLGAEHVSSSLSGGGGAEVAASLQGPALREMDVPRLSVSASTLERWVDAYEELVADARAMGIPASAVPSLPRDADEGSVRAARQHLTAMIASFASANI
ncbi:MAG: hypothetical protein WDW36_006832 [Sanguina aurantia]